jgi:site-specific DNA-methyltransferase (adenine-specific)
MSIEPYYSDEAVTLYCGDFRDLMSEALAIHGEPDLVVADPPYGETSLDWDRWPNGWPEKVPGRSLWCFGSMRMFLDRRDEFASWKLSQDVVWEKHNGSGFHADRFRRIHEHAVHWYRDDWADVHHEVPVTMDARKREVRRKQRPTHTGDRGGYAYTSEDGGPRLHTSVIKARSMHGSAINETEKPAGLVELLVGYACPPRGLVFDVFAGGCSTLVAARNSGRRVVGFELRESQCAKAVEHRLSQCVLPFGEAS